MEPIIIFVIAMFGYMTFCGIRTTRRLKTQKQAPDSPYASNTQAAAEFTMDSIPPEAHEALQDSTPYQPMGPIL